MQVGAAAAPAAGVRHVGWLDNATLMALIAQAALAVLAGGSLLVQAIVLGAPVVAAALKAEQQPRVAALAAAGAIVAAPARRAALSGAAAALVADPARRAALAARARALGWQNGLEALLDRIEALAR